MQRARPALGTTVVIRAEGPNAGHAIAVGFAAVEAVHRSMSFQEPDSDLSRINRLAARLPQPVPLGLARVLRAALALAKASGGRFDPTVGARLVASGHLPRPDGPEPDPVATWRDVRFDADGRVRYLRSLWLDLGGIAKGFAVDRAVDAMRRGGATTGFVNAGGDLRVFGDTAETLRVRDPRDPARSHELAVVRDGAVATSAGYFSVSHGTCALLDGRDGTTCDATVSVTVAAPRAIWADALTKVVLVDEAGCLPLLRRLRARAARIDAGGIRILS